MSKDPFKILGLSAEASKHEITETYRRLAREHHPDVSISNGSISRMQEINWAYEVLSSPAKRQSHYQENGVKWERVRTGARGVRPDWSSRSAEARFPSNTINLMGGTADRAIVGAIVGLVILGISLIIGFNFASTGALLALVIGVWVAAVPNAKLSTQHGAAIGSMIGLFYAVIIGVSLVEAVQSLNATGAIAVCAPSMIMLGGTLGAILGGFAAWMKKLKLVLIRPNEKANSTQL